MELLTALSAAVAAARHLRDLTKGDKPSPERMRELISDLQNNLLDLQGAAIESQERRQALEEELDQLRAAKRYVRRKVGSAVVLVLPGADGEEDGLPCCPNCRNDLGEPLPLQGLARSMSPLGSHMCTACQGTFSLKR